MSTNDTALKFLKMNTRAPYLGKKYRITSGLQFIEFDIVTAAGCQEVKFLILFFFSEDISLLLSPLALFPSIAR